TTVWGKNPFMFAAEQALPLATSCRALGIEPAHATDRTDAGAAFDRDRLFHPARASAQPLQLQPCNFRVVERAESSSGRMGELQLREGSRSCGCDLCFDSVTGKLAAAAVCA